MTGPYFTIFFAEVIKQIVIIVTIAVVMCKHVQNGQFFAGDGREVNYGHMTTGSTVIKARQLPNTQNAVM